MGKFLCADGRAVAITSLLDFVQRLTIGGSDLHTIVGGVDPPKAAGAGTCPARGE